MKQEILTRLRRLEKAADLNGRFIVTYRDGSRKELPSMAAIDAVKDALMVFAKAVDIHIEVALVGLGDRSRALISAEDNVVDEFSVCHAVVVIGAPRWGAYYDICHEPGVLALLVPSVTERGRLHRPDAGRLETLSFDE